MAGELVKVEFHGDVLEAIQDEKGEVWVNHTRCCECLGVAPQSQQKKLKNKPWATTTMNVVVGLDGKNREMFLLHIDSLPMWLATIELSRTKPANRDKLIKYQKEAAKVLADHFYKRTRPPETSLASASVAPILEKMLHRIEAMELKIATGVTQSVNVGPVWTVESRCLELGWDTSNSSHRANIREWANDMIRDHMGQEVERNRRTCVYSRAQVAILDKAIRRERLKIQLAKEEAGPGLFDDSQAA